MVSVWQTTDQDHGKAVARWSIRTLLRAEMTLARRNFSKFDTNASTVLRYCQGRLAQQRHEITHLAQAAPRNHAFGTGSATQPWKRHAAAPKRDNVPGRHAAQRHATPNLCTQPHASLRSFHATHARPLYAVARIFTESPRSARQRHAAVATPDLCTQP